jgi:ribose 5-phosphate isomerase B
VNQVITLADVPISGELKVPSGAIITPSARDLAKDRGVKIVEVPADQINTTAAPEKTVALGSDHGGFALKETLKRVFEEHGLHVTDIGVHEEKPADYPDIARQVAELVARGAAARGVIIDGAGIGSCIVANKFPGIRAALCYDKASARNSREHNDSNILTLGGRLLTATQAEDVLRVWLSTSFGGGRHAGRIQKISEIEKEIRNWTPRS